MRGFLAIVRREVGERRGLLAAAAFASLIPLAIPLLRGAGGVNAPESRGWAAFFMAFAFAAGISSGLGATMLAQAIASRRIAFDFSRPLSAFAIWGARVSAALLLAVSTTMIVCLPASLAGAKYPLHDLIVDADLPATWPLVVLAALLILFSLCHALALPFRSRSGLLAIDFALALLTSLGFSIAFMRLLSAVALEPLLRIPIGVGIAGAFGLLGAGYASVARGRTSIRAAHRSLSIVLWATIGVAVIGANAYASWILAAGPTELTRSLWVSPAASGSWITVSGSARGADATFLYDTASGRFTRTHTEYWRPPVISGDGKSALWFQADSFDTTLRMWTWRLDEPATRPRRTRLALERRPTMLVLSHDGARLAILDAGFLSIHDLASDKSLLSARFQLGERERAEGIFVSNGLFRVYRFDGSSQIEILELDVASRTLLSRGRIDGLSDLLLFTTDPAGGRLLTLQGADRKVQVFDGRDGTPVATLTSSNRAFEGRRPVFLSDGRIVLAERSLDLLALHVYSPRADSERTVPLPIGAQLALGGEVTPGQLVVGIGDDAHHYSSWLVGIDNGLTREIARDLEPALPYSSQVEAGSDATKLFYGPNHSLVHLDPLTGERRVLLGAR